MVLKKCAISSKASCCALETLIKLKSDWESISCLAMTESGWQKVRTRMVRALHFMASKRPAISTGLLWRRP